MCTTMNLTGKMSSMRRRGGDVLYSEESNGYSWNHRTPGAQTEAVESPVP